MQPIFGKLAREEILEWGLLTGKWSIAQFNGSVVTDYVCPSWPFLDEFPQFCDPLFRDLDAYNRLHNEMERHSVEDAAAFREELLKAWWKVRPMGGRSPGSMVRLSHMAQP